MHSSRPSDRADEVELTRGAAGEGTLLLQLEPALHPEQVEAPELGLGEELEDLHAPG